ncbi:MAG: hypothetical protein EPO54_01425 [Brevundimonas sp.]|nr:MAG: hypothetical protein EPO54_01425 [Brevundimonas sp.]
MTQKSWTVPVQHLDANGLASADHVHAPPCVELLYSFAPVVIGGVATFEGRCWALIDTGADINLVDQSLVPVHARFNANVRNVGVSGEAMARVYLADMLLCGSEKSFTTQFSTTNLGTSPYRMILGRLFLRHTRFRYEGLSGITSIEVF